MYSIFWESADFERGFFKLDSNLKIQKFGDKRAAFCLNPYIVI